MSDNELQPVNPAPIAAAPEHDLDALLPISCGSDLTEAEVADASRLQNALNILGPVGGGALICPGNQINLDDVNKCPYSAKCVLLRARKAPEGQLCPIEAEHITTTFKQWVSDFGKTSITLTAAERSVVSELVWLDLQEHRCASILSKGDAARMTQMNPKEVHPETLLPIAWERVIHANAELLDRISAKRRMLYKEWMINPEQKAKQARWEKKGTGTDTASLQAAIAAKLRSLARSKTIIVTIPDDDPELPRIITPEA